MSPGECRTLGRLFLILTDAQLNLERSVAKSSIDHVGFHDATEDKKVLCRTQRTLYSKEHTRLLNIPFSNMPLFWQMQKDTTVHAGQQKTGINGYQLYSIVQRIKNRKRSSRIRRAFPCQAFRTTLVIIIGKLMCFLSGHDFFIDVVRFCGKPI